MFFDIKQAASEHKFLTVGFVVGVAIAAIVGMRRKQRLRGGFFNLDSEKNLGLLGGAANGPKAD